MATLNTSSQEALPVPVAAAKRHGVLQRTCACGGQKGPSGECASCRRKRLARKKIQPALRIGAADDRYEREADRIAAAVLRAPADHTPLSAPVGVQRVGTDGAGIEAPPSVDAVLASSGQPLGADVRSFMESRMGHDFAGVRVHTDARAAASAREVGARAYTVGRSVVFGDGEYAPATASGRRLLAHELVHTLQQGAGGRSVQRQDFAGCAGLIGSPSPARLMTGRAVHAAIAAHFMGSVSGALGIGIPGASAAPIRSEAICGGESTVIPPQRIGGRAGMGFPDLAARDPAGVLSVAEIKPAALECLVDGEVQLAGYVGQGNATDAPQQAWRTANGISVVAPMLPTTYQAPTLTSGNVTIRTAWCTPGLMAYAMYRRDREPRRVPDPVPVTDRVVERDRLRDSVRERQPERPPVQLPQPAFRPVRVRANWSHFWQAVILAFALYGAAAAILAASDGPLPVGDLLAAGLTLFVIGSIAANWDELWLDAERIANETA